MVKTNSKVKKSSTSKNPAKKTLTRVEGKKKLVPKKKPAPKKKVEKKPVILINTVSEAPKESFTPLESVPLPKKDKSKKVTSPKLWGESPTKELKKDEPGFTLFDLERAVRFKLPSLHEENHATRFAHVVSAALSCFLEGDLTSWASKILQYTIKIRRQFGEYEKFMKNN